MINFLKKNWIVIIISLLILYWLFGTSNGNIENELPWIGGVIGFLLISFLIWKNRTKIFDLIIQKIVPLVFVLLFIFLIFETVKYLRKESDKPEITIIQQTVIEEKPSPSREETKKVTENSWTWFNIPPGYEYEAYYGGDCWVKTNFMCEPIKIGATQPEVHIAERHSRVAYKATRNEVFENTLIFKKINN